MSKSINYLLKILAVMLISFSLFYIPEFYDRLNLKLFSFSSKIAKDNSETEGITIIEITDEDLEYLKWPIKRNYYALLLNELNKYNYKAIGFEVFLSDDISFQNIYNSLLVNSLKKPEKIVFSSLFKEPSISNNDTLSGILELPIVTKINPEIKTGHINIIDSPFIKIPFFTLPSELPFSYRIVSVYKELNIKENYEILPQFSPNDFTVVSFLRLLKRIEKNEDIEHFIKDKIILIGVTAKNIANTTFNMPGIFIHANAVISLQNEKIADKSYYFLSGFVLLIFPTLLSFILKKKQLFFGHLFLILFISLLTFVFYQYLNIKFNIGAFYLLSVILMIFDVVDDILSGREKIVSTEAKIKELSTSLNEKKTELTILKEELGKIPLGDNDDVIKKIDELNNEITNLKKDRKDNAPFDEEKAGKIKEFFGIIYFGKKMKAVVETIQKIADEDAPVLLLGESGSGKEIIARAIHNYGNRKNKKFIAVNCAALSETLLESELFGHVKGAFTGAVSDKQGRFQLAGDGTLFLDEIGETSENFQVKLLRVLQSGEYEPVGGENSFVSKARIITATNRNLNELVEQKKFRKDLYYRINVIKIDIPTLNERRDDIPALSVYFAKKENANLTISKAVMDCFLNYNWKGNVRELEAAIKRASIYAKSENRTIINLSDISEEIAKFGKHDVDTLILDSLRIKRFSHSSINDTAKELGGLSRTLVSETLRGFFFKYYTLNKFDIDNAAVELSQFETGEPFERVKSKGDKYIENIKKDLEKIGITDFETIKNEFASKYKNLPNKFHVYLDEIIKHLITNSTDIQ